MASKTKEKLIDVARQLFARQGVENTTMNDIASASNKGRRTIYTHFKSKTDIFNAVVKSESNLIIERIADVPQMKASPEEKLMTFIFRRFEAIKEVFGRNGSLRASFFRDAHRVDKARKATMPKEVAILKLILSEGVEQGVFNIRQVDQSAHVMLLCLQGLDMHYIRDSFSALGIERNKFKEHVFEFVMNGIKVH